MDSGQLVPDEVTIDLLSSELEKFPQSKGFIFDGFVRNLHSKMMRILCESDAKMVPKG